MSERPDSGDDERPFLSDVGLCSVCRHGQRQRNPRGSAFWRCRKAEEDPAFRRYPPLPVTRCQGHEAAADRSRSESPAKLG
jgi:hypothetical protein